MKTQKLAIGTKVRYVGKFYPPHPKDGKVATIVSYLGDDGYEIAFGKDKELWYAVDQNLEKLNVKKVLPKDSF